MAERRKSVLEKLEGAKAACGPLLSLVEEQGEQLAEEKKLTFEHVRFWLRVESSSLVLIRSRQVSTLGVTMDHVHALYDHARLQYDCGRYAAAAQHLNAVRALGGCDTRRRLLSTLWGVLASNALLGNYRCGYIYLLLVYCHRVLTLHVQSSIGGPYDPSR